MGSDRLGPGVAQQRGRRAECGSERNVFPPSSGCSNPTPGNINALAANGVLGVGLANQDCGTTCQTNSTNDVYRTCSDSGCTSTTFTGQVANPVASFLVDNNGVIVQLPAVSNSGATTVNGSLIFGIGTENNNGLGTATVLTANTAAGSFRQITTVFSGGTCPGGDCPNSFIDASSKANFFNDSAIVTCTVNSEYYCPATTINLSATNQGQNGTQSSVAFQVAAQTSLSGTNYAFNDVGAPATIPALGNYFEWGLPFFFGRSVYFAIETRAAAGTEGPYYAYKLRQAARVSPMHPVRADDPALCGGAQNPADAPPNSRISRVPLISGWVNGLSASR
ncbi:MAG: DUF3443 family protein [Acetobacteraceae bacterium]